MPNPEIEKVARALAVRAVLAGEMIKRAQPDGPTTSEQALRYGLIGAGLGGGTAGLLSALSGRRRSKVLRDILLGGLVGGVGGGVIPVAIGTGKRLAEAIERPGGFSIGKAMETATKPLTAGISLGGGIGAERLARHLQERGALSAEVGAAGQKLRSAALERTLKAAPPGGASPWLSPGAVESIEKSVGRMKGTPGWKRMSTAKSLASGLRAALVLHALQSIFGGTRTEQP